MSNNRVFIEGSNSQWKMMDKGVQMQILTYDSEMMMTRVRFEKGAVGTSHSHPHRQITYIESGSFEVEIGSKKQVLKEGDSFMIPADVEHGVVALEVGSLVDVFTPARDELIAKFNLPK